MGPQPPKPLLLCLDAFGTLFTPIRPIAHQYTEVARTLGHTNFTAAQVGEAFKAAYKHEARERPNFGRAVGWGAEGWWREVGLILFRFIHVWALFTMGCWDWEVGKVVLFGFPF